MNWLIISLISFSNCASCVGKIAADLTKESLATTDSITITIINGDTEGDDVLSGAVSGLSLHPSSGVDVALTCSDLSQIAKGGSGTVTCTPATSLTTAGTFTLVAAGNAAVNAVSLTVDGDSKTLTISPDSGNTNNKGSCKGKIAADLTKKSLAITDSITITITNGNEANDAALSGAVSGLSLHPSSGVDVALTCSDLSQIAKGASGTVTCTPATALTTAGTFTLVASAEAKVGSKEVPLTVDAASSKTLTIDPNYTEDSGNNEDSGNTDKKDSGSFNKLNSFLLIGALLL